MANAHGRRHDVSYIAETTFGTTPTTPAFVALNTESGFNLNREVSWFDDTSIRSDRNRVDTYAGNYVVRGSLSQPLRPTEMDSFWESLLWGTWTTNVLKNGNTRKSFAIERNWKDITQYQLFNGVLVDSLKLDITNNSFVKATWGLIGMTGGAMSGTSADSDSTYTAQSTATPFGEAAAVITEGGSALGYCTNVSLTIENATAAANVLGTATTYDLVPGEFKVTGTAKALFQSSALYAKFSGNTSSTFQVALTSGANSITLLMSNIRYKKVDVPNTDGLIEQDLQFEAFYNSTDAATLKITRV